MAVFNNGSITATVTEPQGYSGSYEYELFKYENNNWVTVVGADEGFAASFVNPITKIETTHTFGNPVLEGYDDNIEGDQDWVGLVPGQYKIVVTTLTGLTCEVEGVSTVGTQDPALSEFTCSDANFQVADGTTDEAVVATVAAGTLNSVSPAQYVEGSATYTANITVPAGYSNAGATLTTCTDTATGTTVEERTWYYFHGVDDDWLRMTGGGLLDASSYGLFNNGTYTGTPVTTLTDAMAHYFDNSNSLSNGMDIGQFEMNESITNNGEATQIVFNELINGEVAALYYLLIPNNSLFTENLVTDNLTIFPYPGLAGNAADRQPLEIDGVDYYIYLLQGSASVASRTCSFS
jgi:hypothetical protein